MQPDYTVQILLIAFVMGIILLMAYGAGGGEQMCPGGLPC